MAKRPRPSATRAPRGTRVDAAGPTAVMRPPEMRIVFPGSTEPFSTSTTATLVMASVSGGAAWAAHPASARAARAVMGLMGAELLLEKGWGCPLDSAAATFRQTSSRDEGHCVPCNQRRKLAGADE